MESLIKDPGLILPGRREFLKISGCFAGLSWLTILNKRENFRQAFANFEAEQVATFDGVDMTRLMCDAGTLKTRFRFFVNVQMT